MLAATFAMSRLAGKRASGQRSSVASMSHHMSGAMRHYADFRHFLIIGLIESLSGLELMKIDIRLGASFECSGLPLPCGIS